MRRKLTDNDIFWDGAGRHELLERLTGSAGSRVKVVAGPVGIGVSTLLGEAAMELVDMASVVRVDARETADKRGIMEALMVAFGASHEDFSAVLKEALAERPVVLVIDNAHLLQEEGLQAVAMLRKKLGRSFSALLGATDSFPERLYGTELEDADVLRPEQLDIGACADFLESVVDLRLDDEMLVSLHRQTDGLPGALLAAVAEDASAPVLRPPLPWRHIAAVLGLALLLLVLWPRGEPEPEVRELSLPPMVREVSPEQEPAPESPAPSSLEEASGTQEPAPELAAQRLPEPLPEPAVEAAPPQVAVESEPPAEPVAEPTEPTVESEPDSPTVVRAETGPQLRGLDAELGYRREDWLLGLPESRWMLQLTLATTEDAARALLDRVGRERGGYYRAEREERTVYVVLSGPYPSRAAALGARETLPSDLAAAGPFPRALQTIHDELANP